MKMTYKILPFYLLMLAIFTPTAVLAHSNHNEPLTDTESVTAAAQYVRSAAADPAMAAAWGLDESWQQAAEGEVVLKTVRRMVVLVLNTEKNRTLYILMDGYGGIFAANFSGKFKGFQ